MGVDLVKKGFHVESLPTSARISYGDGTNAQDLANYNVFVIPEPNIAFTSAEITAIRSFVQNGGGLFMIADHAGADRNNDGIDAAGVFNQLDGEPERLRHRLQRQLRRQDAAAGSTTIPTTTTRATRRRRSSTARSACPRPAAASASSARRR